MFLNNRTGDGKAQTHALRFGRIEGFENSRQRFSGKTVTRISHGYDHVAVIASLGLKGQNSFSDVDVVHCIHSVKNKIQEDLLEPDGVSQHHWKEENSVRIWTWRREASGLTILITSLMSALISSVWTCILRF